MSWVERYVSVAGGGAHDGTSEANAWTLAEAIAAPYAAGQRINVKAGTYTNTTTTRLFSVAGTTTAPIWWRGYASTIGDLDDVADGAASGPEITFTTGVFDVTGSYHLFSSLRISGAQTTAAQVRLRTGTNQVLDRCRVSCTSANANGRAVAIGNTGDAVTRCHLSADAAADVVQMNGSDTTLAGCYVQGGADGASVETAVRATIVGTVFDGQAGDAILTNAAARIWVVGNTIYSPGSDGIELGTTIVGAALIANNIFSECGGYGINNSTGANTANVVRHNNLFHNNTSGTENGFGDWPAFGTETDGSSPFTNAAGGNFGIVDASNAKANGMPGKFENLASTSYLDIGAVQRQEPAGGGGGGGVFIF